MSRGSWNGVAQPDTDRGDVDGALWGEAYLITGAAEHWIAHRRDNGRMLAACGPAELRELIIEDYAGRQVPQGTERRASA